jgi:hypothetical protein
MAFDKITALAAPPGSSLTGPMGKWAWEQPPQFSDPNDAVDFVVNKMRDEDTQGDLVALMAAGITVEELVDQVAFKGFMQGFYNPDVAELIKPKESVDDDTFYEILKERNPELYTTMLEAMNEQERMGKLTLEQPQQNVESQNFLNMDEV